MNGKISIVYFYVIPYSLLLLVVLGLMCAYPKTDLHLLLNCAHTGFQDSFFKSYTLLAEWPLYVLALIPLLFKKPRITLFFVLCELTGGAILQILKHTICAERPVCVFENLGHLTLPLVQGVSMHHSNSFPSGHASTFFMFCTCIAIFLTYYYNRKAELHNLRNQILCNAALFLLLVVAIMGAFSRVYLSQHFLHDICVGSIVGFTTPFLMFCLLKDKVLNLKKEDTK